MEKGEGVSQSDTSFVVALRRGTWSLTRRMWLSGLSLAAVYSPAILGVYREGGGEYE